MLNPQIKKIVFIASYMKSGNTWMRAIICSLLNNGNFKLKDLKRIKLFSQETFFSKISGAKFQDNGNFITFSGNPTAHWAMPFNGDGAYSGIADNEEDFYLTIQRGVAYKMKLDSLANRLQFNRLDPLDADSTKYQFFIELISGVSIPNIPFSLEYGPITIKKEAEITDNYQSSDNLSPIETIFYFKPASDFNPPDKNKIVYGPFLLGPSSIPFKDKIEMSYHSDSDLEQLGIYMYDAHDKSWGLVGNDIDKTRIKTTINSGGIYSVIKDRKSPSISDIIPTINSTYRHDHFEQIQFQIDDKLSGIKNEGNVHVFLNGEELIVEYNPYRKTVYYNFKNHLDIGSHSLKIEVNDNAGNINSIDGIFFIK